MMSKCTHAVIHFAGIGRVIRENWKHISIKNTDQKHKQHYKWTRTNKETEKWSTLYATRTYICRDRFIHIYIGSNACRWNISEKCRPYYSNKTLSIKISPTHEVQSNGILLQICWFFFAMESASDACHNFHWCRGKLFVFVARRPCYWIRLCEYINQIDSTELRQTMCVIQLNFVPSKFIAIDLTTEEVFLLFNIKANYNL